MENKHIETEYLNDRTRDILSFQILQIPINFHVLNFNRWFRIERDGIFELNRVTI